MNEVLKQIISHIELPADQLAEQDPEIREIFIEEVQEILESLDTLIPQWMDDPANVEILKDIRRSFHTLKGSGRMAGAVQSGELAWSIEELLNRLMAGSVELTPEIQHLVYSVNVFYPILVAEFETLTPHQIDFRPWIVTAQRLRDGSEVEPELQFTIDYYRDKALPQEEEMQDAVTPSGESSPSDSTTVAASSAPTTEEYIESERNPGAPSDAGDTDIAPTAYDTSATTFSTSEDYPVSEETISAQIVEVTEEKQVDIQMMDIFLEESHDHLNTIAEFLQLEDEPAPEHYNQLIRAIHTIRGSSGMVGVDTIFLASSHVEHVFKHLSQESGQNYTLERQLLRDYYEYVKAYAEVMSEDANLEKFAVLDAGFDLIWATFETEHDLSATNTQGLVAKLLDLDINELLDAEFSFIEQFENRGAEYLAQLLQEAELLQENTNLRQTDALNKVVLYLVRCYDTLQNHLQFGVEAQVLETIQQLHQYLIDVFDGLASGQNIVMSHLMVAEFEAVINEIEASYDASTLEKVPEEQTPIVSNTVFDPDLLDIFLEESEQLVIGMDEDFNIWEQDPSNTHVLNNLFRYLHTLKGGANMVRATHLGDVAHELESIYENILKGSIQPNTEMMAMIRFAQDNIATRLQYLTEQQIDSPDPALIATLHQISNGDYQKHSEINMSDAIQIPVTETVVEQQSPVVTDDVVEGQGQAVYVEDVQPANTEFDADLLEIFLEESEELVVGMDEDFNVWEKNLQNTQVLKNLFRYLHTLKGGANMVRATHLGDVAHELESIYERVLKGSIQPSAANMITIRYAQDDIATRLQKLSEQQIDLADPLLIAQLRAIVVGGHVVHDAVSESLVISETSVHIAEDFVGEQDQIETELLSENTATEESVLEDASDLTASLENTLFEESIETNLSPVSQEDPAINVLHDVDNIAQAPVSEDKVEDVATLLPNKKQDIPPILAKALQSGDETKIIIAQSYYEEAQELLLEGNTLFGQWVVERNNRSILLGLQRVYHTLKGISRMVEEQLIGVMAYQLELVFEQFAIHEFTSGRYDTLLRHTQKWLNDSIFLGKFEGAESIKSRLQAITYEDALVPDLADTFVRNINEINSNDLVLSPLNDQIDFNQETTELVIGDGSEPPSMYAEVKQQQDTHSQELIRISADLVEKMIDLSGESAINRSRIELDLGQMTYTLKEMELAIHRLADQLRRMEGELEAQILTRHESESHRYSDFDPLEMDQYSSLNQLSKSLAESASDLIDFKSTLSDKIRDTENLLLQQSRIQNELQQSLMGTRLVPFSRLVPRLQRLVRQTSTQLARPVDLNIENTEGELDRNILERLVNPLEHMLRNAIDHGIEEPTVRREAGKSLTGSINLNIAREGNDILVIFSDDGAGINVEAVKTKAKNNGLITADMQLSDVDIMQYIFHPGLSTAQKVTQISGRGVGLDVVQNEIKALGGHVSVISTLGKGTEFTIRVPTTVAVSNALMVKVGDQQFALPLAQIERIVRVSPVALMEYYDSQAEQFELDNINYRLRYVGEFVTGHAKPALSNMATSVPVIIYNSGGRSVALQVDQLVGSRAQIVIKPIGQQLSSVGFVGGATILADGRVTLILDGQNISRKALTTPRIKQEAVIVDIPEMRTSRRVVMVVDDSVTVRKVTSRLLERQGFDVVTAKDGLDAVEKLATVTPDLMLLDIEMPRMDGFEVAQYVRHTSTQNSLPIIMITSRTGEKHRERAFALGVNQYMGKPFQEAELIENINLLLEMDKAI